MKKFKLDFFVETATTYEGKIILLGNKHRLYFSLPGHVDGDLAVFTVDGKILMHSPRYHSRLIWLSHSGRYYAASYGHEVRIWEVPDKLIQAFIPTVHGKNAQVKSCDVSFDGNYIATLQETEQRHEAVVKIWETHTTQEVLTHLIGYGDYARVNFSPDGNLLAVSSAVDDIVKILSIPNGNTVTIIEHDYVELCFFSADGNYLITAGDYGRDIKVWKPE